MGAVAWAIRHRPVSHPRSSNRTCGFPASGFPTCFIVGIWREENTSGIHVSPSPWHHDTAFLVGSRPHEVLDRLAPSHRSFPSLKAHQKPGPFPPPELPGLNGTMTLSDTHPSHRPTTAMRPLPSPKVGLPRLPRPPFQRAVPNTPVDRTGACVGCFPVRAAFPVIRAGRHPHLHFRGLLRLHSRYGPPDFSTARSGLCRRASTRPVARPTRLPATRSTDNSLDGTSLRW